MTVFTLIIPAIVHTDRLMSHVSDIPAGNASKPDPDKISPTRVARYHRSTSVTSATAEFLQRTCTKSIDQSQ